MESNVFAQALLNNLPCTAFRCRHDPPLYTIEYASDGASRLFGKTPKELVGSRFLDLAHPDGSRALRRLFKSTLSVGEPLEATFRLNCPGGEERYAMLSARITDTDAEGMPSIVDGMCVDVSGLLRTETSKMANKAITRFLTKMSMEIRTPMNAILGMAEIGLRGDMPDSVRELTGNIKQAGSSLMLSLGDVMDYAALGSGEMEVCPSVYSLSALMMEVSAAARSQAQAAGLDFRMEIASGIPDELVGDSSRIAQALMQLLSNAVKFTDDGYVSLSAGGEESEGMWYLSFVVEDTGRGIKPENMGSIFSEFNQFDEKRIDGSGLGLVIARGIARTMDGDITASSVFGVGSMFTLTVPQRIGQESDRRQPAERFYTSVPGDDGGHGASVRFTAPAARVLVVDDIQSNLVVAEGLLELFGLAVDLRDSGAEALEAVKSNEYDLIFMDHLMPVMDGVATTKQLRGMSGQCRTDCRAVPIVALTANSAFTSREMFNKSGFDDLLLKPIEMPLLSAVLEKWIPKEKQVPRRAV